jgi:hypothetical protein
MDRLPGLLAQQFAYIPLQFQHVDLYLFENASKQLYESNNGVAQFELVVPMYQSGVASLVPRIMDALCVFSLCRGSTLTEGCSLNLRNLIDLRNCSCLNLSTCY